MKRTAPLLVAGLCVGAFASPVAAEVVHDGSSQRAFGFDEDGGSEGTAEEPGFDAAWQRFAATSEGARILERLNRQVGYRITIRVAPNSEIPTDSRVWGMSQLIKRPDESPGEVVVWLANDLEGAVQELPETIYHELRHVEFWFDDDFENGHDELHANTDDGITKFQTQASDLRTESTDDDESSGEVSTPIWDELEAVRQADTRLSYIAEELGDVLDLSQEQQPTYVADVIDVTEAVLIPSIDTAIADLLNDRLAELTPIESDGDGACARSDTAVVCGQRLDVAAQPGDALVGVRVGDMIPRGDFDHSLNFFAVFESDGDEANNLPAAQDGFENDPFEGADSWYRMYNPTNGSWAFFRQGTDGAPPTFEVPSAGFGIVDDDAVLFLVPAVELPAEFPRVRLGVIGYENDLTTGPRGMDVLGQLGSDPMIGLDGSRVTGPVTGTAQTSDSFIFYFGPTIVPSNGVLQTAFCVYDATGEPRRDHDVAATLGLPPDGPLASHNDGTTDGIGCVNIPLPVNEPPGESVLHFFDGVEVAEVSTILLVRPTIISSED